MPATSKSDDTAPPQPLTSETAGTTTPHPGGDMPAPPKAGPTEEAASDVHAAQHQATSPQSAQQTPGLDAVSIEPAEDQQASGLQAAQQPSGVDATSKKSIIDATFGLAVRQRTKVMTGVQADKFKESRSFQVHL